jgi:hypothetical protein
MRHHSIASQGAKPASTRSAACAPSFDEVGEKEKKGLARRDEIYPLIAGLIRAERTHRFFNLVDPVNQLEQEKAVGRSGCARAAALRSHCHR